MHSFDIMSADALAARSNNESNQQRIYSVGQRREPTAASPPLSLVGRGLLGDLPRWGPGVLGPWALGP